MRLELNDLPFDRGGALLVKRAVRNARRVVVSATHPDTFIHLRAWRRAQGHDFQINPENNCPVVTRGDAETQRLPREAPWSNRIP